MILLKGRILRFKGRTGIADAQAFETELQGRCIRDGSSITITHETKLSLSRSSFDTVPTPIDFVSNGHRDAHFSARPLPLE